MTYEEYLDEVTTLMTEIYHVSDEDAIKHVMRAQAADFFTLHDDHPEMRTQERAEQDVRTIYEQRNKSRPHTPPNRTKRRDK
jgi:predicted ArsR family transcriptional regulator